MLRALVSVMLFVVMVSSTFLTIGIGTQNTYPVQFLSIVDIVSMDSNASPQHLFATYVAGRILELSVAELPFLQNIDPRYLHVLIYDGEEFIEIPLRIYTKVIHFNPGSSLSGKLYVVPKKMSSNTVIDIKLPPIYPKPLDEEALSKLPLYLRGSILYPVTLVVHLENGISIRIPIIFAIAKIRNLQVIKNSIDYDNVVEDFELYGVEAFYKHVIELRSRGIAVDVRKLVNEYISNVLKPEIANIAQPLRVPDGVVEEWNVVEFVAPFETWSTKCTNYPCTIYPWFRYVAHRDLYPGVSTKYIAYLIEVLPFENQGGSSSNNSVSSTVTRSSPTTASTTYSSTTRITQTSYTSIRTYTLATSIYSTRTRSRTTPTTITGTYTYSTLRINTTTEATWTIPSGWLSLFTSEQIGIPTPPFINASWLWYTNIEEVEHGSTATSANMEVCRLVVKYYTEDEGWKTRSYGIYPYAKNLIWFEWYFPNVDDNISRVEITIEDCSTPTILQVKAVAVGQYMPNVEDSKLSNKILHLYPLGSPSGGYAYIRLGPEESYIALENVLPIPILQALLYKFVDGYSYDLVFNAWKETPNVDVEARICVGSVCSDWVELTTTAREIHVVLDPEDVVGYFEALRNLPIVVEIKKIRNFEAIVVIEPVNTPIKIVARPMRLAYGPNVPSYLCTTTFTDNVGSPWNCQYQVRGSTIASYIFKSPLTEGIVIKSSYSSLNEYTYGYGYGQTTDLGISTFYYGTLNDRAPFLLNFVEINVSYEGIAPSVSSIEVKTFGGSDPLPELPEVPLPLSVILSMLEIPALSPLLEAYEIVSSVWNEYLRPASLPGVDTHVGEGYAYVKYVAPSIGAVTTLHIQVYVYRVALYPYQTIIKVVQRFGASTSSLAVSDTFSDALKISIVGG